MLKDFDRITFNPKIMGRVACIRGMRVAVSLVFNLLAHRKSKEQILEDYLYLELEDIDQCFLLYAAWLSKEENII